MAPLGNLVRLQPLHINELPAHPLFESLLKDPKNTPNGSTPSHVTKIDSTERPNLISFVEEVLDQATLFVDDTLPNTFKEGSLKSSAPSEAQVRLLSRSIGEADIRSVPWVNSSIPRNWSSNGRKPTEAWFARRSRHANHSGDGTVDFDEFDFGLRQDHSKHEQDYTPDVFDSYKVLDWNEQIKSAMDHGSSIDNYRDLNMSIYEMCHELPTMLSNRVFPVLVVTAKRGKSSFVVVQIPVDVSNLTAVWTDLEIWANARSSRSLSRLCIATGAM